LANRLKSSARNNPLLWAYGIFFVVFLAVSVSLESSINLLPSLLVWGFGGAKPDPQKLSTENTAAGFIFLGSLLALEAAFIWGGGRVSDKVGKRQWLRNLVSISIAALLTAGNVFGIVFTFSDWADRFDSDRSTQYHGFFQFADLKHFVIPLAVGILVVVFVYFLLKNRYLSRREALHNLILAVAVSSALHLAAALPTQVVVSTHLGDEFLASITPSLFTIMYAVLVLLWCAGVLAYLRRFPMVAAKPSAAKQKEVSHKGGPYIESAKTIASLLLVIAYFGINQAISRAADLDAAVEARAAFSSDLVRNYLSSFAQFQSWRQGEGKSASETQVYDWLNRNLPERIATDIAWVDTAKVKVGSKSTGLFVSTTTYFFRVEVLEYKSAHAWTSNAFADVLGSGPPGAMPAETAKVAVRSGIELRKDEDFASLYLRIENALLRKQVALPSSGFSFPVGQVVWICLLVTIVMLVLLQDRIRNVFADPDLGRGEPWLILDAEGRLAKALSTLWIVGIFAGPCLLAVLSMRVASLEIRSDGSVSYLVSDVLSYLMLLALAASAGVLSLRVIANVTQLRRKQREVKILGDDYE
jgi:hypothetical protein